MRLERGKDGEVDNAEDKIFIKDLKRRFFLSTSG
jgi:hypothetical protein